MLSERELANLRAYIQLLQDLGYRMERVVNTAEQYAVQNGKQPAEPAPEDAPF